MKKPWWVRAIGWAGWLVIGFGSTAWLLPAGTLADDSKAVAIFVFVPLTVVLFVLWALVSFIFKAIGWNARAQADRAAMTLQGLSHGGPPIPIGAAPARGPDVWDNPPTKIRCDVCGRFHALLYCLYHLKFLCFPCCAKHDDADCHYEAAGRRVDDEHKEPYSRRAPGKVLGI